MQSMPSVPPPWQLQEVLQLQAAELGWGHWAPTSCPVILLVLRWDMGHLLRQQSTCVKKQASQLPTSQMNQQVSYWSWACRVSLRQDGYVLWPAQGQHTVSTKHANVVFGTICLAGLPHAPCSASDQRIL